jgi:hypothetical protein
MTERYMYGAINDPAETARPLPGLLVVTGRTKSSALPALSLEGNPSVAVKGQFLTGTPKQLEIHVTHTKQNTEVVSNRDTNTTPPNAIEGIRTARAPALVGLVVRPAAFGETGGYETLGYRLRHNLEALLQSFDQIER